MKKPLILKIVADNALVVNGLRHFLEARFGSSVLILCSYDLKSCMRNIGKGIDVVVLDYFVGGMSGKEVAGMIHRKDPSVVVVLHSDDEGVARDLTKLIEGDPEPETRYAGLAQKSVYEPILKKTP
jgi:DNA-binding NarL/FixJ family response regulator